MSNKIVMLLVVIPTLLACFIPKLGNAICFQNCQQAASTSSMTSLNDNSIGYQTDNLQYRERSHNTRDVKNSVMGDVNIHVGHDRMDIKMDSKSNNNTVNASVSSTIILGDMKQ